MKLADFTAKVTGMKFNAVRVLAAATLAGAVLIAAAPAAQAQHVRVMVGFGGPRVFVGGPRVVIAAPPIVVYGQPGFYGGYGYRGQDWRFRHDGYRRGWR
jgi:hypothetical protein